MTYPDAVRRAGHADGDALFDAMLSGRSGITFTLDDYEDAWRLRRARRRQRIALEIPELLDRAAPALGDGPARWTSDEFPLVLVGRRAPHSPPTRSSATAWRKRDADGALRISPQDAGASASPTAGSRTGHDRGRPSADASR